MASGSLPASPVANTLPKDVERLRSASPASPAAAPPDLAPPVSTLLPEAELRQPYWTNFSSTDLLVPRGNPYLTVSAEELVPFNMTDEELFSFRYLDHPTVAVLVPFARRLNHWYAADPAFLEKLFFRAVPVFVRARVSLFQKLIPAYALYRKSTMRTSLLSPIPTFWIVLFQLFTPWPSKSAPRLLKLFLIGFGPTPTIAYVRDSPHLVGNNNRTFL